MDGEKAGLQGGQSVSHAFWLILQETEVQKKKKKEKKPKKGNGEFNYSMCQLVG